MKKHLASITTALVFTASLSLTAQVPNIARQPESQRTTNGGNVTFTVDLEPEFPTVSSGSLRLWLKANEGVVTNVEGKVSQWLDQSGAINHAAQGDTNLQPTLTTSSGLGGQPVVRFNGSADNSTGSFLSGNGNLGLSNAFTSFLVYSMTYAGNNERVLAFVGQPGSYGAGRGYYVRYGEMSFAGWTYDTYSGFIIPTNTYRIWTDRLNTNRTSLEFFDKTADTSTNIVRSTSGLQTPAAGYYIGGLNPQQTAGRFFAGDIAELIYFSGSLSDADRLAVENYLEQKYLQGGGSSGSFTFQWQFNGTNIVGATNASLTLTNVQPENEGFYSAIVSNFFGSTTSSNALLTLSSPPDITAQPESQEVAQGATVSFSVTASGELPLTYQWLFNGNALSNATASSLFISNVQPIHAGNYSVVVSDGISSVTSSNATLNVDFAPTILAEPQSAVGYTKSSVTFAVSASGFPLQYQWFLNSSNAISGATNASLTLSELTTNDAGAYSVTVSNDLGSQSSSNALLTVIDTSKPIFENFEPGIHEDQWSAFGGGPVVTNYGGFVSPSNALWFGGSGSRFATTRPIDVSNGGILSFQLRLANGRYPTWDTPELPMEGVVLEYSLDGTGWTNLASYNSTNFWAWTSVQLILPAEAQSGATLFRWRQVHNSGLFTDNWALDDVQILSASSAPEIFTQPQSTTVAVGSSVNLSVLATGQSPLSYQWVFGSNTVVSTNATLAFTNALVSDSGNYFVIVSNAFGSVTSVTAVVSVLIPPSIASQPQSQTVVEGTNVSFGVGVEGSEPLNYQWRFNGSAIPDATNSVFLLTNVQGSDAGEYSVDVSNPVGSIVSSAATLSIDSFPVIVTQPQDQSVLVGSNATFTVGLQAEFPSVNSGSLRLWLRADEGVVTNVEGKVSQWLDQSGAINHAAQGDTNLQPTLTTSSGLGGQPVVRFNGSADNSTGSFLNGNGNLGLSNAFTSFLVYSMTYAGNNERVLALVGQPGSYGASRGYYVLNGDMSFAGWAYDSYSGFIIPTNTYRIWTDRLNTNRTSLEFFDRTADTSTNIVRSTSGLQTPAAGYYIGGLNPQQTAGRFFAGDIAELIYFSGSLNDTDRLAVENYLEQKYLQGGGSSGSFTFQWQFNGTNIVGATNASLTLTNVQPENEGVYSVVIGNSAGSVSSVNAALFVNIPPHITSQPQEQSVNAGGTAAFSVGTAGTGPFSYQWQKDGGDLNGATNATLTLNGVQMSDAADYRVIVTTPFGSVTSSNATLDVSITEIRVVSTNAASATSFDLPIEISALGTENAVGFSLAFDPNLLSFDSATLDAGLSGALLIANTDQLINGKVGLAVALPSGTTLSAGTHALLSVTFHVGVTTTALNSPINFADSPTLRETSDAVAEPIPSLFTGGAVAISAVDFEGDVAPRPNGSRTLTTVDWVQVGRFAAGLDSPTNPGEFQRADCAPRSELGNGAISVTDWVQAGRYATGADPMTPAGGPAAPSSPDKRPGKVAAADGIARTLMINATNQAGLTKTVSVQLVAQGNENAIGFSVAFDPSVLTFNSAATGGNAAGAILNVNTKNANTGRIGFALSLSTGAKFTAGTQEVIRLTFTAAEEATGSTPLTFVDSPVIREISDTSANALPAAYSDAALPLTLPGPLLSISKSGENILLTWPASATNYVLEGSAAPGSDWTNVVTPLVTNGENLEATLPLSEQQQFYRLKQ